MTDITRFSPFDETFDDLLRGFFVRPIAFEGQPQLQLKMDVTENGQGYTVHAEMPGVKKEDIQVSIDGNRVSISAEVKRSAEQKDGERVLKSERYYGKLSRTFTLASEVDAGGAQARFTDGVLELALPKKTAASARQIIVQ
jgi:HSP20 family protein